AARALQRADRRGPGGIRRRREPPGSLLPVVLRRPAVLAAQEHRAVPRRELLPPPVVRRRGTGEREQERGGSSAVRERRRVLGRCAGHPLRARVRLALAALHRRVAFGRSTRPAERMVRVLAAVTPPGVAAGGDLGQNPADDSLLRGSERRPADW